MKIKSVIESRQNKNPLFVQDIICAVLICAAVVHLFVLAFRGLGTLDESFYLTIPHRISLGDAFLTDEWHLSQFVAFVQYIPFRLFYLITGSTDGIVLYSRIVFITVQTLISVFIYQKTRKISPASVIMVFLYSNHTIIHQIRNSTKYVSYKDIKALMADLKKVYGAVDEETALYELEQFSGKWDSKYPKISQSWQSHWAELSTYFKYPQSVRTLIYTTNSIENFNRQLRKVTKSKAVFPNDDSLLKMLYLAQVDITRKWTDRRRDWGEIHSQPEVFFAERLSD